MTDIIRLTSVRVQVRSDETRRGFCEKGGGSDGIVNVRWRRRLAVDPGTTVSSGPSAVLGARRCVVGLASAVPLSAGPSLLKELWNSRGLRGLAEKYVPGEGGESKDSKELRDWGSARARPGSGRGTVGVGSSLPAYWSMILSNGEDGKGSTLAE